MRITYSVYSFVVALFLLLILAVPAFAMDFHDARTKGLVGERLDGFVEALVKTDGAPALAADVNSKRKAEYARIAKEKGQTVDVVAKLAASEIIKSLESGASYQDGSGGWKKR